MATDWKQHHANEAEKAFDQPLVKEVIEEFVGNMKSNYAVDLSDGLPHYGLMKVAMYVASVARAEALGFDPNLLRLSPTEATEAQLRLAQMAAELGKPVWVLELEPGAPND